MTDPRVLPLAFELLIRRRRAIAAAVASYLDRDLDRDAMAAAIWQRPPGLAPAMMELERWQGSAA
jgi:hypothetical protein